MARVFHGVSLWLSSWSRKFPSSSTSKEISEGQVLRLGLEVWNVFGDSDEMKDVYGTQPGGGLASLPCKMSRDRQHLSCSSNSRTAGSIILCKRVEQLA